MQSILGPSVQYSCEVKGMHTTSLSTRLANMAHAQLQPLYACYFSKCCVGRHLLHLNLIAC